MARRGVNGLRVARRGPVAAAIVRRTKMRAALEDFAGDLDLRLPGIETLFALPAVRRSEHRRTGFQHVRQGTGIFWIMAVRSHAEHTAGDEYHLSQRCIL